MSLKHQGLLTNYLDCYDLFYRIHKVTSLLNIAGSKLICKMIVLFHFVVVSLKFISIISIRNQT